MRVHRLLSLIALLAATGCGAAGLGSVGAEEPTVPRGERVELTDLVPAEASGAALVEVARLRPSRTGRALIEMVRRVGAAEWEEAVEVDLAEEVDRLILFVTPTEGSAPGDLSSLLATAREGTLGMVLELSTPPDADEPDCYEGPLSQAVPYPLQGPAPSTTARYCGRFIVIRSEGDTPRRAPDVEAALALAAAAREVEGEGLVLSVVVGPAMVDRASCDETTAPLEGWQLATVDLGEEVLLRGRYHAATVEAVPALEQCVTDGLGGFGGVPLLAQLEIEGLIDEGDVAGDPEAERDVMLLVDFALGEFNLMMGLLELLGEGIQSDAATQ